jgi:hypothetical protein
MVTIHRSKRAPPTATITDRDERCRRDEQRPPPEAPPTDTDAPDDEVRCRRRRLFRTGTPELVLEGVW